MVDLEPAKKKHRGIPEAQFLDDVEAYMKGSDAESQLVKLDEQYQKYKFMETNLLVRKRKLTSQIPDIKSTIEAIKCLKSKKEASGSLPVQFMLSDQLFVTAQVPPTDKVALWLGANVMLEYDIDEAAQMLGKNLTTAETNFSELDSDLAFLRDQITTTEVSMARVYNWDVKRRQTEKKK